MVESLHVDDHPGFDSGMRSIKAFNNDPFRFNKNPTVVLVSNQAGATCEMLEKSCLKEKQKSCRSGFASE